MKNKSSFTLVSALVAFTALVLTAVNIEFTASAVFAIGLVALLLNEYAREIKPLPVAPRVSPIKPALKLAA